MTEPVQTERSWAWHLTRVSGLVLAVLVPLHFVSAHIINDTALSTGGRIATRWRSSVWRALDWAFLTLALVHGGLGIRALAATVLGQKRERGQAVITAVVLVVTAGLVAITTFVLFTYEITL
ncbi:MAG: hypothetical protein N2037_03920 [Acidimicrobiales bacterium]|nr:hypothetical protein [Acidimicrobiales bacterium]